MAGLQMSMTLEGADKLMDKLNRTDEALRNRISVDAVRAGGEMIVNPIRARAPSKSGGLAASVDSVVRHYRQSGLAVSYTGPSYPRGSHGVFKEKGTQQRRTRKGANRGLVQPEPFVDPVVQANRSAVLGVVTSIVKRGIEVEASK